MSTPGTRIGEPAVESHRRSWQAIDWYLIAASLILLTAGLMSLYSIDAGHDSQHFARQVVRLAVGVVPFLFFLWVGPRLLFRFSSLIYALNIVMLVLVLLVGREGGGAQRWIRFGPLEFQPSEMAKLLLVITLAAFFARRSDSIKSFWTYALSLVHMAVPLALVFLQPHLGASLVLLTAWLGVSLAAGMPAKFIVGTVLAAAALLGVALTVPGILKSYQKERVYAMFGGDTQGSRWQTTKAQIAFGAGGLTGVGFLKGEQKEAGFVPEQHNDFIFTVVGEEGGFVGSVLVLAAFAFFLYRIWRIMVRVRTPFYRMIAAGIYSILAFHTVVNIGMNLELLPVVGLWLPFMSFGGTAIWLCLACVGLLLNLRSRDEARTF